MFEYKSDAYPDARVKPAYSNLYKKLVSVLDRLNSKCILDLGWGSGHTANALQKYSVHIFVTNA